MTWLIRTPEDHERYDAHEVGAGLASDASALEKRCAEDPSYYDHSCDTAAHGPRKAASSAGQRQRQIIEGLQATNKQYTEYRNLLTCRHLQFEDLRQSVMTPNVESSMRKRRTPTRVPKQHG